LRQVFFSKITWKYFWSVLHLCWHWIALYSRCRKCR